MILAFQESWVLGKVSIQLQRVVDGQLNGNFILKRNQNLFRIHFFQFRYMLGMLQNRLAVECFLTQAMFGVTV